MAFLTVKLVPGVHAEQTPLLLQAGVVQSNNVRWREGLPEKIGGQKRFYSGSDSTAAQPPLLGPIRELWPWADFNAVRRLAAAGDQGLFVVSLEFPDITPQFNVNTGTGLRYTTVAGSSTVLVDNIDVHVTSNNAGSIIFNNYVAVGGLILYGAYSLVALSAVRIQIQAATAATSSVTVGPGVVSTFTTLADTQICTVVLPNHMFVSGQAVSFLPTTLTGSSNPPSIDIVVQGVYTVLSVIDANTFTIGLQNLAANTVGPISEDGGQTQVTTWIVRPPPAPGTPYNYGPYSVGVYGGIGDIIIPPVGGTPATAANLGLETLDWCMVNFGETLIAQPEGLGFFKWSPNDGFNMAQPIPQAPISSTGFFLAMPQQQLVAYGASTGRGSAQDPMLVRWCDNANYSVWIADVSNQAGSYRLSRGSRIVGAMQMPMQAMLWTDIGLWLMTYIGYPDVWGFSEIAQECGLIAKKAAGVLGPQVFWMGRDKFWTFVGGQVQPLPCSVWDAVFQNINTDLVDLIRCGTDTAFDGIGWFFPSLATKQPGALQENDSYVKFNRVSGEWDYGTPVDVYGDGQTGGSMTSDWIDANVFGNPISAETDSTGTKSQLMWMDMGPDTVQEVTPGNWQTAPIHWWFRTGLFLLSEGEDFIFVDRCRPDFKWRKFSAPTTPSAQINFTLYAQDDSDNPSKPPSVYGPFLVTDTTSAFDPRARGRYFSFKVEGEDLGSFARLGAVKFRFSPDGRAG